MNDSRPPLPSPPAGLRPESVALPVASSRVRLDTDEDIGKLRLFLIEDRDEFALLIRKSLERMGHHVTCCRTAADALIILSQTSFDLILLDQVLDDMPGLDLLQRLTREGFSIPVLMVTAHGDEQLATRVLRAGALDYIVKDPALSFLGDLPKRVSESVRRHRLEQMNRLLIQALESARDGIMITDLQGTILHVNQALEQQTGYPREELIGQTPRLLKSGLHAPEFYARMWHTILGRQSWQGELTNRRRDGQLRHTSMTISPIVDDQGRLTHFVGIQRDVTEHKRLEQQMLQMQKMQSVGTLAGGIAHEFNNLMAGINGYASLGLRESGITEPLRQFMQNIVDLSERAATLTRQLLAFARKPALVRQPTALVELLRSTTDLVARTLHQEVELDFPLPSDLAFLVEADANQLQQALVNLALNARDAMVTRRETEPVGSSPLPDKVIFRLRHVVLSNEKPAFPQNVPPGDYLLVQVQDSGVGMTTEVLSQALDPFFTTKEVGQGTGLGLPMVFGIIQGHQGYLTIETIPMQGTCVGLYLPRFIEHPVDPALRRGPNQTFLMDEVVEPEAAPGRSILVIDDEEPVLDVVRRFLEIAGHRVLAATNGTKGVELLRSGKAVDLVILDLMMPREDTQATFQKLRQCDPDLPVLLCTGLAEAEPAPWLLSQPRTALMRKPFRMNELWYAVKQVLSSSSTE